MALRFDRCSDCGCIHLICGLCGQTRTLVKECEYLRQNWYILPEDMAIGVLRFRAQTTGLDCFICDRCWPAIKDERIPKVDPNGYVPAKPKLFVGGQQARFHTFAPTASIAPHSIKH